MGLNRLALAALAAACIGAAGVGGYLASRQNVAGMAAPDAAAASVAPNLKPVQETEASISPAAAPASTPTDTPAATPTSAAPAVASAPVKRTEPAPSRSTAKPKQVAAAPQTQPPTLDRSWPSGTSSQPPSLPAPPTDSQTPPVTNPDDHAQDAPHAPEPPAKTYDELVVARDSVVGLQLDTSLSSERAKVEDRVEARVARDVRVGGHVAIPAGTHVIGTVVVVDRGGKFKERARLGIRFQTVVMADGTRLPITTETIYRYGDAPSNGTAGKIGGGAVVGAIIGGILGGGKGAAIGATTGAGAGTAAVAASDRNEAVFPAGAEVTARMLSPVTVTVEHE